MRSAENKNYYELLGVNRDATKDQIREAYKEIARIYHPDSNYYDDIIEDQPHNESELVFKTITAAYTTLTNEKKRAEYDQLLPKELPNWDGGDQRSIVTPDDEQRILRNAGAEKPQAFGRFGKINDAPPTSAFDSYTTRPKRAPSTAIQRHKGVWGKLMNKLRTR